MSSMYIEKKKDKCNLQVAIDKILDGLYELEKTKLNTQNINGYKIIHFGRPNIHLSKLDKGSHFCVFKTKLFLSLSISQTSSTSKLL